MAQFKTDDIIREAIQAAKFCIDEWHNCSEECPYFEKSYCGYRYRNAVLELAAMQGLHTGHWIDDADHWMCSECSYESGNPNLEPNGPGECPNCHARMIQPDITEVK